MKKIWNKGSVSDRIREYQSHDQLEDLATDYKENVVDELLRYDDAYGFGFYVAAWIAPRLREFIACAGTMCIPWHQRIRTLEEYHESCVVWIGMLQEMQFAMDTVAGLNKGELDRQVADGNCTKEEIRKKVKKGLHLFAEYLQDLEY